MSLSDFKFSRPRLGLYARFFLLFNVTTILLAIFITLGFFTISETEVKKLIEERHDQIYARMTKFEGQEIDIEQLKNAINGPKIQVKVVRGEQVWSTWEGFPEFSVLQESAQKIGGLYFVKHRFRYYLLTQKGDTQVALTALLASVLFSSGWLVYWPWVVAFCVFSISYMILRRWLYPIAEATRAAKLVSQGQFDVRIEKHPKTELAELTRGLNTMAADLQQLFDAKNELLLAISHELRTPMARMKVALAMLDESSVTADLNKDIRHMDELIEQLLEAERLEQGHKVLHLSSYYLPSLVDEILSEQEKQASIELVNPTPEEAILLDVGRIKFLLRNLLRNAISYSPQNSKIQLAIEQTDKEFMFHVKDHGPGIPRDIQDKIFEAFYRAEHIDNRSTKGVGLGLYLCRKIALAHQGSLTVTSKPGEGSCFTLSLPR